MALDGHNYGNVNIYTCQYMSRGEKKDENHEMRTIDRLVSLETINHVSTLAKDKHKIKQHI